MATRRPVCMVADGRVMDYSNGMEGREERGEEGREGSYIKILKMYECIGNEAT